MGANDPDFLERMWMHQATVVGTLLLIGWLLVDIQIILASIGTI